MAVLAPLLTPLLGATAATATATFFAETLIGRLLVTVATSALMSAGKTSQRMPGITSQFARTGSNNPLAFQIGTFATTGTRLAPWLSHGNVGKTPNAYLTLPVIVSTVKGEQLKRIAIDGEWTPILEETNGDYGRKVGGRYLDRAWITYYDGSQTAADPLMLAKYGTDPDYPWSASMIGSGLCIAYIHFRYDRKIYNGLPTVVFETSGIPLYDPRLDTTVGGSGTHRWDDRSTWEPTDNGMVQAYNTARGITVFTDDVWGGDFEHWRLPLSNWIAAMNACDIDQDGAPKYRTGYEVEVSQKPSEVMKELAKGCAAQFAETAGILKVRVGGPGLPVMVVSDADFIINKEMTERPFPSIKSTFNGVRSSYPEPASLYGPEDAPVINVAALEAEDNGQRHMADLRFAAVPYGGQVNLLGDAYVKDGRRFRRHAGSLQGAAALLEPLDTITYNSDRHNYVAKAFEVSEIADDLKACIGQLSLLERDSADWVPPVGVALFTPPPTPTTTDPDAQGVPGWSLSAGSVLDDYDVARTVKLTISWSTADLDDVRGIQWTVRVKANQHVVATGTTMNFANGSLHITSGLAPDVEYEAQGELIVDRPTTLSAWVSATTPDVRLGLADLDSSVSVAIAAAGVTNAQLLEDAEDFADDAEQWALEAAEDALSARLSTLDHTFEHGLETWSHTSTGDDANLADANSRLTEIVSDDPEVGGKFLRAAGASPIYMKKTFPVVQGMGNLYELTFRVRRDAYVSGDAFLYLGIKKLTETKANNGGNWYGIANKLDETDFPVSADYTTFTAIISDTELRVGTKYIRLLALLNYNSAGNTGNVMSLSLADVRDVTAREAAKDAQAAAEYAEAEAMNAQFDAETASASAVAASNLSANAQAAAEQAEDDAFDHAAAAGILEASAVQAAADASGFATAAASKVTEVQARIDSNELVSADQLASQGQNLVVNGSGLIGDNTGFSEFVFDPINAAAGGGSFSVTTTGNQATHSDNLIPVDPLETYRMAYKAKKTDGLSQKKYYGFVACYDIDRKLIAAFHTQRKNDNRTTLAAPLNVGDTTVTVADASDWNTSNTASQKYLGVFGYKSSGGYQYPDYTYTRYVTASNAWASTGISGNVVTLNAPIPASMANPDDPNGEWPIGTPVANMASGGSFNYIAGSAVWSTDDWVEQSGTISGLPDDGSMLTNDFRHGTAYVKLGFLAGYVSGNSDAFTCNFSAISFGLDLASQGEVDEISASVTVAQNALADLTEEVGSHVVRVDTSGATAELQVWAKTDLATGAALSGVKIRSDLFEFEGDLAAFLGDVRITGGLIANGATSRRAVIGNIGSTLVTGTGHPSNGDNVCFTQELEINFEPYTFDNDGSFIKPDNPAMFIISGAALSWVGDGKGEMELYPEGYNIATSSWEYVDLGWSKTLRFPASFFQEWFNFSLQLVDTFGNMDPTLYSKFRIGAWMVATGSNVVTEAYVGDLTVSAVQMNK